MTPGDIYNSIWFEMVRQVFLYREATNLKNVNNNNNSIYFERIEWIEKQLKAEVTQNEKKHLFTFLSFGNYTV